MLGTQQMAVLTRLDGLTNEQALRKIERRLDAMAALALAMLAAELASDGHSRECIEAQLEDRRAEFAVWRSERMKEFSVWLAECDRRLH